MFLAGCGGQGGSAPSSTADVPAPSQAEVFGPDVVAVSQFYRPEHGNNWQPAYQAAIDQAQGTGRKVVNDKGAITAEMWAPLRTSPFAHEFGAPGLYEADGIPLVIRHPVHMDFRGAKFVLRGPTGGAREQAQAGGGQPWLGGWLYVIGYNGFGRVAIENVTVDGGFAGNVMDNSARNLSDKGIRIHDTEIREISVRNVELRNFAAEIFYVSSMYPYLQMHLEDCHFHGTPQSALNPSSLGTFKGINLQLGRAYSCAETIGGKNMSFVGGRFYGPGHASFFAGPKPSFKPGFPWWYNYWDGVGEAPFIEFQDTRFEDLTFITLSSWIRGKVITTDTPVIFDYKGGRLCSIDLVVEAYCAKSSEMCVALDGPPTPTTQLAGGPDGVCYELPTGIRLKIDCRSTEGTKHKCAIWFGGGLLDSQNIAVEVSGGAWAPSQVQSPVSGFVQPQIVMNGFVAGA